MRTDELKAVLHEHGDDVRDVGTPARVAAVHQRVRTAKRRRAAAAGGGLVAAVAAVVLAVGPGLPGVSTTGGTDGPVAPPPAASPASPSGPSPDSREEGTFSSAPAYLSYGGVTWTLTRVQPPRSGEARLRMRVGAVQREVLVLAGDNGLAPGTTYRVSVDGRLRMESAGAGDIGQPTWSTVDVLPPGEHQVLLEITKGSVDGGWVAVAEYMRAD